MYYKSSINFQIRHNKIYFTYRVGQRYAGIVTGSTTTLEEIKAKLAAQGQKLKFDPQERMQQGKFN